jgi:alpha-1,3-glucan synthase
MDCDSVKNSISISSSTHGDQVAQLNNASIDCLTVNLDVPTLEGAITSGWRFKANLTNVYDGVHTFTVNNASDQNGLYTNAVDHFMFRIGQPDNPIVFPSTANYTRSVLQKNADGDL